MTVAIRKLPGRIEMTLESDETRLTIETHPFNPMTRAGAVALMMEAERVLNTVRFAPEPDGRERSGS